MQCQRPSRSDLYLRKTRAGCEWKSWTYPTASLRYESSRRRLGNHIPSQMNSKISTPKLSLLSDRLTPGVHMLTVFNHSVYVVFPHIFGLPHLKIHGRSNLDVLWHLVGEVRPPCIALWGIRQLSRHGFSCRQSENFGRQIGFNEERDVIAST